MSNNDPMNEIRRIETILEKGANHPFDEVPDRIEKQFPVTVGGNSSHLMFVFGDKAGRLWIETPDALILAYRPTIWRG